MFQDDEYVVALLAKNLEEHFRHLVEAYQHRLYAFVLRQTGSGYDADDITQEALIRAYFALKSYPTARIQTLKLQSWLYKITLNVLYSRTHGSRPQLVSLEEENAAFVIADQSPGPEEEIWWLEYRHELERLVAALPEHYRAAVNLRYFEDLGYQEIAELLHQPPGTVKANVHRGVKLLRKMHDDTHMNQVG